mgnify:CR=1 FL=1
MDEILKLVSLGMLKDVKGALIVALILSSFTACSVISLPGLMRLNIVNYKAPTTVVIGSDIGISVRVNYDFPFFTRIYIGVWDLDSNIWLDYVDEQLSGTGTKEYTFRIKAPNRPGTLNLAVYAFYLEDYNWILGDKVDFTINVIRPPQRHIEEYVYLDKWTLEATTSFDLARSSDSDGNGQKDAFVFITVPPGLSKLSVMMSLEYDDDIDMRLYDPYGNLRGVSHLGIGTTERITVSNPAQGLWKLVVEEFHIGGPTAWVRLTIKGEVEVTKIEILGVTFSPTRVAPGGLIKVRVTIRNVGTTILNGKLGPNPGFKYNFYEDYGSVGYPSVRGYVRIGVDFDKRPHSVDHPYRWGLGRDLGPGEEVTVVGYLQAPPTPGRYVYWVGVVKEGVQWFKDRMGATVIEVTLPVRFRGTGFKGSKISGDGMSADIYAAPSGGWHHLSLDKTTLKYEIRNARTRRVNFKGNKIYAEGSPGSFNAGSKVILLTRAKFTVSKLSAKVMTSNSGGYNRYGTTIHLGIVLGDGSLVRLTSVKIMPGRWYTLKANVPPKYANYHLAVWMTQSLFPRNYYPVYEFTIGELKYYKPTPTPTVDYSDVVAVKNYGTSDLKIRAIYSSGGGLYSLTLLFNGHEEVKRVAGSWVKKVGDWLPLSPGNEYLISIKGVDDSAPGYSYTFKIEVAKLTGEIIETLKLKIHSS